MKKVMIMTNALHGGGAEKVLQDVLRFINTDKYDITLYTMHSLDHNDMILPEKIKLRSVFDGQASSMFDLSRIWKKIKGFIFAHFSSEIFYRLFINEKFELEIAFIEGESTKIIAGSNNSSKKIAWVHIDLNNNPWTSFLYKNIADETEHYKKYDKIVCVSESVREAFLSRYKVEPSRVLVVHNPINRSEILSKSDIIIQLPKKERFRIITVGRLVKQKGYHRVINIGMKLKNAGFDFEWFILGEGNEKTSIEKRIKSACLEDHIVMTGYIENPYPYIKSADLYVCSSIAEGFSISVAEAIVLGIPVISTDCAGVEELFGDMQCGIITENNETSLYNAIEKILNHKELLSIFRKNCQMRSTTLTVESSIRRIEEIFDE